MQYMIAFMQYMKKKKKASGACQVSKYFMKERQEYFNIFIPETACFIYSGPFGH